MRVKEIEKIIVSALGINPPIKFERTLRRQLRALVKMAETHAFKSGMEAATQNPQWRMYKPFLDQYFKRNPKKPTVYAFTAECSAKGIKIKKTVATKADIARMNRHIKKGEVKLEL